MKHTIYTFQQFNHEMNNFYKYLEENNFSEKQIQELLLPLQTKSNISKKWIWFFACIFLTICIIYCSTYIDIIAWHFSAIGRIILIKCLPFWNWIPLKNEKCLLENPFKIEYKSEESVWNCDLCENLDQIDVYDDNISGDWLKLRYMDLHTPVIVRRSWSKTSIASFIFDELLSNEILSQSVVCNLATNIHNGADITLFKLLSKTNLLSSFFLHFQNCDFSATKEFRQFTPKPSFVPPELSPVQYNWLLWSQDYNATTFKMLPLVEKFTMIGQIFGANQFRLMPRGSCDLQCRILEIELKENESLFFSSLWNLEYRPIEKENIAVILEMH